ncbi:MAG: VWA domain-containing protein [Pyrinomonadaceae bacterium]
MRIALPVFLLCLALAAQVAPAQETRPAEKPRADDDEVLSVNTVLVQTDVRVYDRAGRFVADLRRDQFELRVDGKVVPVSFFELVEAGGEAERAQLLAAARGAAGAAAGAAAATAAPETNVRGRSFYFFLDDLHLSPLSLMRARKAILDFVEREMTEGDQALVVSATNAPGFLQQLTGNKAVLRAALSRLSFRNGDVTDGERPVMNDVQAQAIERGDTDVIQYFISATASLTGAAGGRVGSRQASPAEIHVRRRARMLVERSVGVSTMTFSALRSFVGAISEARGQKLAYFISDGFVLDTVRSDTTDWLRRLTDAAARAGVVFYTLDAHGLEVGLPDATSMGAADIDGSLARSGLNETLARQDVLHAIAADTGGRAIRNTNALGAALASVAAETSRYYLLAWRPEGDEQHKGKFKRLQVRVIDRPDLTVRVRAGFLDSPAGMAKRADETGKPSKEATTDKQRSGTSSDPVDALAKALGASEPRRDVNVSLSVGYLNVGERGAAAALVSLQVARAQSAGDSSAEKTTTTDAAFDIACAVLNDRGARVGGFRQKIGGAQRALAAPGARAEPLGYTQLLPLAPGLYQIRVAARDARDGRTGAAFDWIEVPDTSPGHFAISSIFVGVSADETPTAAGQEPSPLGIRLNADRTFARGSRLRFLLYIYNAARAAAGSPDLTLWARVTRAGRAVIDSPPRKLQTSALADPARIPHAAEVPLERLPPGSYTLEVIATDNARHANARQTVIFTIK